MVAQPKAPRHPEPRTPVAPYWWERLFGQSRYREELARLWAENLRLSQEADLSVLFAATSNHTQLEDYASVQGFHITHERHQGRDEVTAEIDVRVIVMEESAEKANEIWRLARDREIFAWRGRCWIMEQAQRQSPHYGEMFISDTVGLRLRGVVNHGGI